MSRAKKVNRRPTSRPTRQQPSSDNVDMTAVRKPHTNLPKFVTLAPLTVRLRHDQVVMLTDIERKIMSQRRRGERRERITKSTIIRVLIDLLPDLLTDTSGIADEGTLIERLHKLITK